jgi:predicted dehydrogenase
MKSKKHHSKIVKLAIIGTGGMADHQAQNFKAIEGCKIVAVCDIDPKRAAYFAAQHEVAEHFTDTAEMLKKVEIDAVTVVTPDAFHAVVSLQCLKAGKHILCEKPLAVNYADAKKMTVAAKKAGVINMVNFTYRNMANIQEVATRVQRGDLGEIRHVEASYMQTWLSSTSWGDWREKPALLWRLSTAHGSKGVLGDIGVHIVDFATYPAGPLSKVNCKLKTFPKVAGNRIGEYKFDANDSAILNVEFKNGAIGIIHTTRWATGHTNQLTLKIFGTKGAIEIDGEISQDSYRICVGPNVDTAKWETVTAGPTPTNYQRFIRSILAGKQEQPDFARGAEVQKVLDACFVSDKSGKAVKL